MNPSRLPYSEYVGYLYERGYYVSNNNINITSDEISCINNNIIIRPLTSSGEDIIYIFTGTMQKEDQVTEFVLYLEDNDGYEFEISDSIKIILIDKDNKPFDILRRHYYFWKLGVQFDHGISLDKTKILILEATKDIGKFDIEIRNVDIFKKKLRPNKRMGMSKILRPRKVSKLDITRYTLQNKENIDNRMSEEDNSISVEDNRINIDDIENKGKSINSTSLKEIEKII